MIDSTYTIAVILAVGVAALYGFIRYRQSAASRYIDNCRDQLGFTTALNQPTLHQIELALTLEERWAEEQYSVLSKAIQSFRNPPFETMKVPDIISRATTEERRALQKMVGASGIEPEELDEKLRSAGSSALGSVWRVAKREDPFVSYEQLVLDAGKHLKANVQEAQSVFLNERSIQKTAVELVLGSLSADDQAKFLAEFAQQAKPQSLRREAVTGGALAVANLSGFGLYLASSTALGAITSAIGITLPFAVYTGLSSTLAVVIGPVGWAALGIWLVHKIGKPNAYKVISSVLLISNIRLRLISVRDEPVPALKYQRDTVLDSFQRQLRIVRSRVKRAELVARKDDRLVHTLYALPPRPVIAGAKV